MTSENFTELRKNNHYLPQSCNATKMTSITYTPRTIHLAPINFEMIRKELEEDIEENDSLSHSDIKENLEPQSLPKSSPVQTKSPNLSNSLLNVWNASKTNDSFEFNFGEIEPLNERKNEGIKQFSERKSTPGRYITSCNDTPCQSTNSYPFVSQIQTNWKATPSQSVELNNQFVTPMQNVPKQSNRSKPSCVQKINFPIATSCRKQNGTSVLQLKTPKPSIEKQTKRITVNGTDYKIQEFLGCGGSSEVFGCLNPASKERVAIKCVSLHNSQTATGYINEVNVLRKLQNCDKIIKMIDYQIVESEKKLFVVLEKGGDNLSKIIKNYSGTIGPLPIHLLVSYWMEMLYAVLDIHKNGIVHSDLKPANFLIVNGALKLIDFGIASCLDTDMTSILKTVQEGTCNYISPESLNNESTSSADTPKIKITFKSDVWSLGCILYELVYGRTPFQHIQQLWPKLQAILNPKYPIQYPDVNLVPPKIIATIKKCLQHNVKLRPSVQELIDEYVKYFDIFY